VKAFWEGIKALMILTIVSIGIGAYVLIPFIRPESKISNIRYFLDQKFLDDNGPNQESYFKILWIFPVPDQQL
jgi:hypothetical protein